MNAGDMVLPGGRSNRGRVTRRGPFVVRPQGDDSAQERLLIFVSAVFDGAPTPHGRDEAGRLLLQWIGGDTPEALDDERLSSATALEQVGMLLRRLHDATAPIASSLSFISSGLADPSGQYDVICHCDPSPGNVVFSKGSAKALIDWEYASPGRRAWDLAVALIYWSPLRHRLNFRAHEEELDPFMRARQLLNGYQASVQVRRETVALLGQSQAVAARNATRLMESRGPEAYERWVEKGGLSRLARDAEWLEEIQKALSDALI